MVYFLHNIFSPVAILWDMVAGVGTVIVPVCLVVGSIHSGRF